MTEEEITNFHVKIETLRDNDDLAHACRIFGMHLNKYKNLKDSLIEQACNKLLEALGDFLFIIDPPMVTGDKL